MLATTSAEDVLIIVLIVLAILVCLKFMLNR